MKRTSILLTLISIFLCNNILLSSEIANSTPHRHAELFLRYFHTISFKNALNVFNALDQNNQNHVLQTIPKEKQVSFCMLLLPSETQFQLCTNCDTKDIYNFDTQAVMNSRSIKEHFEWLTKINELLKNGEFLTIKASLKDENLATYFKNKTILKPGITLNRIELFTLEEKQYNLFYRAFSIGYHLDFIFSKKEFTLLTDLPNSILEKLRFNCAAFSYGWQKYADNRIKYEYKKPINFRNIAKYGLKSYKEVLPAIIASLLVCYGVKWSFPDLFKLIQDPILIAEKNRRELANIFINQVKNDNIPGSEFLRLENINEIPFTFISGILNTLHIIGGILIPYFIYNYPPYIPSFLSIKKTKKTHYYVTRNQNFYKYYYKDKQSYLNKYLVAFFSLFGTFIPFIPYSHIVYPVIFFSSIVIAIINGIMKLKNTIKTKVIDFPRPDFEKLSVKEILTRYLNKTTKIIL